MVDARLGQRIQMYREKAGISQEELADHIGVSITSISNIERGANYPSFENFIKILNHIGASPNEVMLEIVDKAEATKTNELWDNIQDLDLETKKKILKILEVLIKK